MGTESEPRSGQIWKMLAWMLQLWTVSEPRNDKCWPGVTTVNSDCTTSGEKYQGDLGVTTTTHWGGLKGTNRAEARKRCLQRVNEKIYSSSQKMHQPALRTIQGEDDHQPPAGGTRALQWQSFHWFLRWTKQPDIIGHKEGGWVGCWGVLLNDAYIFLVFSPPLNA